MTWILMLLGLAAGGMIGGSLSEAVLGALIGTMIGQTHASRQMRSQNAELREALKTFETRFEKGTRAVVERLLALEQNAVAPPVAAPPSPEAESALPLTGEPAETPVTAPSVAHAIDAVQAVLSVPTETQTAADNNVSTEAPDTAVGADTAESVPTESIAARDAAIEVEESPAVSSAPSSLDTATRAAPASTPRKPRSAPRPRQPAKESLFSKAFIAAKTWLLGGNVVLRVGILLLFLGLAFLLRYATKDVVVPIELRYAGVALAGFAMIALGWALRRRNESYSLIMQGGGIGVMYLTVFAALRLHPLLPSGMALTLLVLLTAALIALALLQNAVGLASAAIAGAFAAPILTSTGSGNHVALFSYFTLLNAALMVIAWYKAWRVLNLIGFVGTFGIGFAWGLRSYTPALLGSTEPFLVLFFLMYVAIGLLFTRRKLMELTAVPSPNGIRALLQWSRQQADYVDASLMFGPPLVGFGLQYAVVSHLEFGAAFSALVLGLFYLGLGLVLRKRLHTQGQLLIDICLALGVIFGTLAIPLALDAHWTAAAWAVEGAGIYWIGLRQQRPLARLFALLLQFGAAINFMDTLTFGDTTLLDAEPLGSLLLGVSMLFSHRMLLQASRGGASLSLDDNPANASSTWEQRLIPVLACTGLAFIYLLAPLFWLAEGTALAWALAGLVTLYFGLRLAAKSFVFCAFAVQMLGGMVFLTQMQWGDNAAGVLASGWRGLMAASSIGIAMIAGIIMVSQHGFARSNPRILRAMSTILVVGLVFINLAVLFVLPWLSACAVWGVSGLVILWLAVQRGQRSAFWFGCLLEVVAGITFLSTSGLFGSSLMSQAQALALRPLLHAEFWTPAVLALAAFVGAWRLQRACMQALQRMQTEPASQIWLAPRQLRMLSILLLLWSAVWWALTALTEIARFVPGEARLHTILLAATVSLAVWSLVAMRTQWRVLAHAVLALPALGMLVLWIDFINDFHLAAQWGWLAWPLVLGLHFWQLKRLPPLLRATWQRNSHILGAWLTLGVIALELHYGFSTLAEPGSAWSWLGWVLVPCVYLVLMTSPRAMPWPVAEFGREYRVVVAAPVALVLLGWFWIANVDSNGDAAPLPFVPLLNPLELALLFALFGVMHWSRKYLPTLLPGLPQPTSILAVVGASLFMLLTASVFRTAHHWADIPYDLDAQLASMLVQASLSILWTLLALTLMIAGHRNGHRQLWLVGGVLIGVVVAKLFFVELGNRGGLERVISFMGVGVLLLVVGYFAPLPPRQKDNVQVQPAEGGVQ